jgi:hypothetical protein
MFGLHSVGIILLVFSSVYKGIELGKTLLDSKTQKRPKTSYSELCKLNNRHCYILLVRAKQLLG